MAPIQLRTLIDASRSRYFFCMERQPERALGNWKELANLPGQYQAPSLHVAEAMTGACPYLALANDSATHALFPTKEHRCLVNSRRAIAPAHQQGVCLTDDFEVCTTFQRYSRAKKRGEPRASISRRLLPGVSGALLSICVVAGLYLLASGS